MGLTQKVRSLLSLTGLTQTQIAEAYGTSIQAINNKLRLERYSGEDLCRIATMAGVELAFILADGSKIRLNESKKTTD